MCNWVLIGLRLLVGLDLQALLGLDLVLSKVIETISCTSESKPLALPCGRTSRLDSGVRSGTLVGQGSAVIETADADYLPRMLVDPYMASGSGLHVDPTKVRIGEKKIKEGQVPLLESTRGRVVPLAGVNKQGNQDDNVQDIGHDVVVEEGAVDGQENPVNTDIVRIEDEVPAIVADKPKGTRKKMKTASGASGSVLPPKRLREDHGTSGDVGASTAEKSLVVLQDLLECSTLAFEVGVTATAIVPFITSSVTPTPEREIGGRTNSILGPNLRTQHPAERFVISSDPSHHSSANAADDEVTSFVRSFVPPPPVLTAVVATTAIVGATSTSVHESSTGPVQRNIFRDSASPSTAGVDIAGPSQPADAEVSTDTFYISQEMDSETLQQTYVPKWNVINDSAFDDLKFNVGVARQACFSAEVRLRSEHNNRERKKFERKCQRQVDLLKEKDTEIANLKAQLFLKEAGATEAIRLSSQVVAIKGTEAARVNRLRSLKGQNATLKGQVAALEFATAIKDTELASSNTQITKLTQDLSNFQLSCDELCVKAASFEYEKDKLID
ncbi:hypothetical protein Tco_1087804 [Tanacetum coccineum]